MHRTDPIIHANPFDFFRPVKCVKTLSIFIYLKYWTYIHRVTKAGADGKNVSGNYRRTEIVMSERIGEVTQCSSMTKNK